MGGKKAIRKGAIITVHHSPVSRSRAVVSLGGITVPARPSAVRVEHAANARGMVPPRLRT